MQRLIAEPATRDAMGTAARARYEATYTADVVVDRIEALYRSLT
jgi:glycosyltransferase involved in cell wall biosynthesis